MSIYQKLLGYAWFRVVRRFLLIILFAALAVLAKKINYTAEGILDSILAISSADIAAAIKVGIGAGILAAIDKIKNELKDAKENQLTAGKAR